MDVSVIIPAYNAEATIQACVESIKSSDFRGTFEIIVVDDGSTDRTARIAKKLNVTLFRQKNAGAAAAKNVGAKKARGKVIIFLDSDVLFFKDTLRKMYLRLSNPGVDSLSVTYSTDPANSGWIHKYKAIADYFYSVDAIYPDAEKRELMHGVLLGGGCEGFKRNKFIAEGGYDEKIKGADIEREMFFLKFSLQNKSCADPRIMTKHYFPGFRKLVTAYWSRTMHDLSAISPAKLTYLERNRTRVLFGMIFPISAIIFFSAASVTQKWMYGIVPFLFLAAYFKMHFGMFRLAFKKHGLSFTLYAIIINILMCSIIAFAGAIGTAKSVFKRGRK